ncbi:MAG TPA: hypothetical protein VHO00_09015 [Actinomycetes bacterium]|nr:hypothetical protein [Actinomycetes bacterium]
MTVDRSSPLGRVWPALATAFVAALLAGLLAGCDSSSRSGTGDTGSAAPGTGGTTPTGPSGGPSAPAELNAALARWEEFPATAVPRPVVVLEEFPVPADGFATNAAKRAFACRQIDVSIRRYPHTPRKATISWPGGTTTAHAVLPAEDAITMISGTGPPNGMDCSDVEPVRLTGVHLGTTEFGTDRGQVSTTAWIFTGPEVPGDGLSYPAVAPTEFFRPPPTLSDSELAATEIAAGGRSLTAYFYGTPTNAGACTLEYEAVVAESATAVAITIRPLPAATPSPTDMKCTDIAEVRAVSVPLAGVLGGRVVVDDAGTLAPVCPAGKVRTDGDEPRC